MPGVGHVGIRMPWGQSILDDDLLRGRSKPGFGFAAPGVVNARRDVQQRTRTLALLSRQWGYSLLSPPLHGL